MALMSASVLAGGTPLAMAAGPTRLAVPDYQVGVVEANQALSQAHALGIGWTRVPLPWASLEPAPNTWNFQYTHNDQTLLAMAADGIVPVGVVQTVPLWASATPADGLKGVPRGLSLPWNNPGNTWGQFMYSLARHYAGLINTWIIGNEISVHSGPSASFDGTTMQMAEMIRVAYEAIKAANPAALVQAPGAPYWYDRGADTNALLTDLSRLPKARQNHDFIDGLNLHLYNTVQWNGLVFGYYRHILKSHGLGSLPIWLSETNVAPYDAPEDPGVTPAEQADFIIENLADSLGYAPHVEVYEMTDPHARVNYGLVSASGSSGPAYKAVQTLTQALAGTKFISASVLPYEWQAVSKPAVVTFGGVRRLVNVVWDQGFQRTQVSLPAYTSTAAVITANGLSRTVTRAQGHFTLSLAPATHHSVSPATNAPIGGPPLIVVQRVATGQAGTPSTPPLNAPTEFAGPAPVITAKRGDETATVNPSQATVTIASGSHTVTVGGWGVGPGQLLGPSGVVIGPQGWVYVTNAGANNVVVYTSSGRVVARWGAFGHGSGQFNGPSGIGVGPHGTVYVADTLNQRIQAFTPTGRFLGQVAAAWPTTLRVVASGQVAFADGITDGSGVASFSRVTTTLPAPSAATALAVNARGDYAVATAAGQITLYTDRGQVRATWTIPHAYGNRLPPRITALAWAGTTLYAVDGRYNRILAINTTQPPVPIRVTATGLIDQGTVTVLPMPAGALLGPSALAVSGTGALWIADTDRNQLLAAKPDGILLTHVALHDGVAGVAVTAQGRIAVTGYYGDSLTEFTATGQVVWRTGSPGHGPNNLDHPTTVVVLPNGDLAVWDTGNNRAVIYSDEGQPVNWITAPTSATALAVWPNGDLAWVTANGVQIVTP
jgi:sugar lactone lactonase YvrE